MMYCYGEIAVCYWEISPDNIIVITSQTKHKECDSQGVLFAQKSTRKGRVEITWDKTCRQNLLTFEEQQSFLSSGVAWKALSFYFAPPSLDQESNKKTKRKL